MRWPFRRRKRVAEPRPSDATATSGRLYSPDAAVNRPLTDDERDVFPLTFPATVVLGPVVSWAPVRERDEQGVIAVDLHRRTVRYVLCDGSGWAAPHDRLDGDGRLSLAAGTVLLRDVAAGSVDHAVAVEAPFPLWTRLAVRSVDLYREAQGPGPVAIRAALLRYGGYVVRTIDAAEVRIVVERPVDTPWRNDPGPVYRAAGLATHATAVGTVQAAPVADPPRRKVRGRRKPDRPK